jgi:hypothetical protein
LFKLTKSIKNCECGNVYGWYEDNLNAVYYGDSAIPLGIDNGSFVDALKNRNKIGLGIRFEAFVISEECSTFLHNIEEKEER